MIKEMREKKRYTQTELSKMTGISRTYLNSLENGRIENTTTDTLRAIAKALDCKVSDIFFTGKV